MPYCGPLSHVWTAPWQELSDVTAALVGCGHVSGLVKSGGHRCLRGMSRTSDPASRTFAKLARTSSKGLARLA
jgi:hypothetical protein